MRAVMVSQKPLFCENIANGKKTILITKTKPSIKTPFKGYIYCTKAKTLGDIILCKGKENSELFGYNSVVGINKGFSEKEDINLKGMVIGEFVCDEVEEFHEWELTPQGRYADRERERLENFLTASCLSEEELVCYREDLPYYKPLYGWHISNLEIYDCPKELKDFSVIDEDEVKKCPYREQNYFAFTDTGYIKNGFGCNKYEDEWCFRCKTRPLSSPPSPWCYIEGVNEDE